jgi:hypothetical protein
LNDGHVFDDPGALQHRESSDMGHRAEPAHADFLSFQIGKRFDRWLRV